MGTNESELARARLYHRVSIAIAVVLVVALVVAFALQWKPWFQAPILLAAAAAVEWQRRCGQKVKALLDIGQRQGTIRAG
jgi:hypothetical protein